MITMAVVTRLCPHLSISLSKFQQLDSKNALKSYLNCTGYSLWKWRECQGLLLVAKHSILVVRGDRRGRQSLDLDRFDRVDLASTGKHCLWEKQHRQHQLFVLVQSLLSVHRTTPLKPPLISTESLDATNNLLASALVGEIFRQQHRGRNPTY